MGQGLVCGLRSSSCRACKPKRARPLPPHSHTRVAHLGSCSPTENQVRELSTTNELLQAQVGLGVIMLALVAQ